MVLAIIGRLWTEYVDSDLYVKFKMGQRQLHSLPDLLFLQIHTTDVRILQIGVQVILVQGPC